MQILVRNIKENKYETRRYPKLKINVNLPKLEIAMSKNYDNDLA